jgi:hypothetical protein
MKRTTRKLTIQRTTLHHLSHAAGGRWKNSEQGCSGSCNTCQSPSVCCYDDTRPDNSIGMCEADAAY